MENKYIPCGGCGATDPKNRCIGCFHPFTDETYPGSEYQELFNYVSENHNVNLLQSEMNDLIHLVHKFHPKTVIIDFIRDIAINWDCDEDGHKHNTGCRKCSAAELLYDLTKQPTENEKQTQP